MVRRATTVLFFVALISGCGVGGAIGRGMQAYRVADYQVAMAIWDDLHAKRYRMNRKGLLRYLVFRGLTHYRMGQRAAASRFLFAARRTLQGGAHVGWIPADVYPQMQKALAELDRKPRGKATPAGATR